MSDKEPTAAVLNVVRQHRDGLLALLEEDARETAAAKASIEAGRIIPFPRHLVQHLHPSLQDLFEERAGVMEFCGGLPRREAEELAWKEIQQGTDEPDRPPIQDRRRSTTST